MGEWISACASECVDACASECAMVQGPGHTSRSLLPGGRLAVVPIAPFQALREIILQPVIVRRHVDCPPLSARLEDERASIEIVVIWYTVRSGEKKQACDHTSRRVDKQPPVSWCPCDLADNIVKVAAS